MSNYNDPRDNKALKNKALLEKIGMLESSGGIDTDHEVMTSGPHKGDKAIGTYGMMPNTLVEMTKRFPSNINEGMSKQELEELARNNPEFEEAMAGAMLSYMKDKRGLSDEEVAAAWEKGHNLKKPSIKKHLDTPRARKFKVLNAKE